MLEPEDLQPNTGVRGNIDHEHLRASPHEVLERLGGNADGALPW